MIKFDFHTHTRHSDGNASVIEMVEAAESRGMAAVAITDHGPDTSVGVPPWEMESLLGEIEDARRDAGIRVLSGIEANVVDGAGNVDVDRRMIERLDFVIFSIHRIDDLIDPSEAAREYISRMTRAVRRGGASVIGHPFHYHQSLLPYLEREEVEEFVRTLSECGVAVELNMRYRAPDDGFLRLCLREGVKFSIGSDAHSAENVGRIDWALSALEKVGARREDMILDGFL